MANSSRYSVPLSRIHAVIVRSIEKMAGDGHFAAWLLYPEEWPEWPQQDQPNPVAPDPDYEQRDVELRQKLEILEARLGTGEPSPSAIVPRRCLSLLISGSERRDGSISVQFYFWPLGRTWSDTQRLIPSVTSIIGEEWTIISSEMHSAHLAMRDDPEFELDRWLCLSTTSILRRLIQSRELRATFDISIVVEDGADRLDITVRKSDIWINDYRSFIVSKSYSHTDLPTW